MKNNIITRIETAISTNSLIYWLSKIPIIKKKISVRFYSEEKYKTRFRGATHIFNAILFIVINTAYPILLLGLTGLIQDVLPFDQPIIYLILWTTLLISANIHSLVYEDSPTKWLLINIFRTNPNTTFLLAYNKRLMNRFIYSFFAAGAMYLIQGSLFHIAWTFILPTAILPISNYLVYTITVSKQHLLNWKQWLTLSLMYYLIPILMVILNYYLFIVLPLF